jgi:hypothetical protein
MFFWARPFFSSPRPAHVFQARPMRRRMYLWPFSPLTHRPTPLRRARSELRPRAAAAPCVPSAVSLGWTPSSPSFLSFPRCLSVSPFLLHGATPSSPDRHRARRCRVAVGRLDLPFSVSRGHQPDPSPPPLSLFPIWAHASHPRARWLSRLASLPPSLLPARHLLLLVGRRCQSPTAMPTTVVPQTRASPHSVGAGASHPHRAPSRRNPPALCLCSEPVRCRYCALHRRWPSPTPHPIR